ncbi:protein DNA-DAMAGE INDUCIBLE 1-like [Quercus robur]|uniref:protein DNA-DAMAGE INDUCIBLE 1-like n=1 Tax=Quercus robur TaxID=38942 RepID=UPI002163E2B9|nr:protein DNA-DAMAGE INDUCIBLE 1-like [Quercus robur]
MGEEPKTEMEDTNTDTNKSGSCATIDGSSLLKPKLDSIKKLTILLDYLQKGIDENWAAALEHNPEAFARVVMLYVDMEVNGFPLKAFVDNGAQSTIISKSCAERCGYVLFYI